MSLSLLLSKLALSLDNLRSTPLAAPLSLRLTTLLFRREKHAISLSAAMPQIL